MSNPQVVMGFVSNLMFTSRIEFILDKLDIQVKWIDPVMHMINHHIDEIVTIKPGLILVDLGIPEIHWDQWIGIIKSNPAAETIPMVCFGSHKDVDLFRAAKKAGADRVISRSQFFSATSDIIIKYVRP